MKFAILGFFLSLMATAPASANLCVPPPSTCKAMTCDCGVCGTCGGKKEKQACEARVRQAEADLKEYESCVEEQKETGTRSMPMDNDEDEGQED